MTDKFILTKVNFIPEEFLSGVVYYSEKYKIAGHLCACGCGEKVMTRVAPAAWSIKESDNGVSMWPSIGNWQLDCKSHYVIRDGQINWAGIWSPEQIQRGRSSELERKMAYYDNKRLPWYKKIWKFLQKLSGMDSFWK